MPRQRETRKWVNTDGVEVEITTNVRRLSAMDMRFDDNFRSPVDGTVITNKRKLLEHNLRNDVRQVCDDQLADMRRSESDRLDRVQGRKPVDDTVKKDMVESLKYLQQTGGSK